MQFRTRLFLVWGGVVVLLYAGTCLPVLRSIESSFDRIAAHAFSETQRDLKTLTLERVHGMRQVADMVMNIPELRALIAEHNFEVSAENLSSLQERLDNLAQIVGVNFVCVLDARGSVIAQNHASPWKTIADLQDFLAKSPQGKGMLGRIFQEQRFSAAPASGDNFGMWGYQKKIYEVVGVPLVFNADVQAQPGTDGALIMAAPLNDDLAAFLAQSQNCQVSFLSEGGVEASSLPQAARGDLQKQCVRSDWPIGKPFDVLVGGVSYRSSMDPLIDPNTGLSIGRLLIQSDLKESRVARQKVSKRLLASMIGGLLAAAIASFVVSGAITKPVKELSVGVQRLAQSDLDVTIAVRGKDELGALAMAFNDMVRQLRARRELERLVEESRAMSKAKSEFLANMSHEIRTPLNGVIGMAELLLRTTLNDRQRRYAGLVKSSAEVLTTLINDILDFSKMEAGKLELESIDFNLHELIEDVVELLGMKAQAKGLQVAADISPQTPTTVRGDSTRLRQVVVNLMNNAVKFTDRGEVVVRVTTADEGAPGSLRIEVIDSGIGIPAERMNRLFQSFSQVDTSTTRRYGGTGLGLAICKQLVELMGGKIGVTSEAGRGSTFWFTMALEAGPSVQATDESEMAARLAGLRALIVDAKDTCRHVLERARATWGVTVETASGAAQAIAAIEAARSQGFAFGAVIVDRQQENANAAETALVIQRCKAGHELTLMLVPLGAETESSCHGCITKPVRRRQLLQTLATALSGKGADSLAPSPGTPGEGWGEGLLQQPRKSPHPNPLPAYREREPEGPKSTSDCPDDHEPMKTASAFRLLVAEDNPVNQMITTDLATNAGYACDVVSDGREAVAAFERGGYDLILMDCQMPEMDGFEAAAAIRAIERAKCPADQTPLHIPIIALTAHTGAEDRARCLNAGMDDYSSKPFVVDQFLKTIRSLLPARAEVGSGECGAEVGSGEWGVGCKDKDKDKGDLPSLPTPHSLLPTPDALHPTPHTPLPTSAPEIPLPTSAPAPFDVEALLGRCTGSDKLALALLAKFESQAAKVMSDLQRQIELSEYEDAGRTAHRLKGTAGILSAPGMIDAAVRVEALSAARDADAFADGMIQFRQEIARCVAYIDTARTTLSQRDERSVETGKL